MKFGRNLYRYQISEWAPFYMNYNGYKRLCKIASLCTAGIRRRNIGITYQTICDLGIQDGVIPSTNKENIPETFSSIEGWRVLGEITLTSKNTDVSGQDIELIVVDFPDFEKNAFNRQTLSGIQVEAGFQEICSALVREIGCVENFYCQKYVSIHAKARAQDHGVPKVFSETLNLDELSQSEVVDILGTCIELREGMRKLMWFGRVNFDSFQKIFRKLDKLQIGCGLDLKPLAAKLLGSQFACQTECQKDMSILNERIANLNNVLGASQLFASSQPVNLERFCTRVYPILSSFSPLYEAVAGDNSSELDNQLNTTENAKSSADFQGLIPTLLRCSVDFGSRFCIETLLSRAGSLNDVKFPGFFLHSLIINTGRDVNLSFQRGQQRLRESDAQRNGQPPLLSYILGRLRPDQRDILQERDSFGRLPLHYAANYGLTEACQAILKSMHDWGVFSASSSCNPVLLLDSENHSPLHLAVIGGHISAAKFLFEFYNTTSDNYKIAGPDLDRIFGELLAIALRSDFLEIVQILVERVNVNCRGKCEETALHIAARLGREDYVKMLLNNSADVNALETVQGWSPLIVACVKGHVHVVDILLQAGANQAIRDLSGRTAKDHAAFRGYMEIAVKLLAPSMAKNSSANVNEPSQGRLGSQDLCTPYLVSDEYTPKSGLDLRSPIVESQVLVNLGSYASNKSVKAVDLSPYISHEFSFTPETRYSIAISAIGATGPNYITQLPILEDMTHVPQLFSTPNPSEVKLVFQVFRSTPHTGKDTLVGSGVALLENLKQGLGSKRESLMRDYTIPMLEKDTLKFIGTVTFSFVIITPLPQPQLPSIATEKLWNKKGPTKIVGHRGLGQNLPSHKYPQIGENSIRSFLTAVNSGASYVELDVQLTKDHVPVIYHDFLVSETGTDVPLHSLSLAQFMHIPQTQSPSDDLPSLSEMRYLEKSQGRRSRSYSLNAYEASKTKELNERMKHTFEYKIKKSKPNTRGNYIHEPFTTLQELLGKLPVSIPLNIEIKYPMLFEATDEWEMETFAIELNLYVNTILTSAITYAADRPIMFSSFSPEICILLSLKQTRYPVLFLNCGGNWPTGDIRASSLQEAIHFAKVWKLDGIVMESDPLVLAPRLIGFVRECGLVCASYGSLNNDPQFAKIQAEAGLNVLIVDRVRLISEALFPKAAVS